MQYEKPAARCHLTANAGSPEFIMSSSCPAFNHCENGDKAWQHCG